LIANSVLTPARRTSVLARWIISVASMLPPPGNDPVDRRYRVVRPATPPSSSPRPFPTSSRYPAPVDS
jgi:hypothetical protein